MKSSHFILNTQNSSSALGPLRECVDEVVSSVDSSTSKPPLVITSPLLKSAFSTSDVSPATRIINKLHLNIGSKPILGKSTLQKSQITEMVSSIFI